MKVQNEYEGVKRRRRSKTNMKEVRRRNKTNMKERGEDGVARSRWRE